MSKVELFHDNFQNFKRYNIPKKAQLVIADIPYNIGVDAFASNPMWYEGGRTKMAKAVTQKQTFSMVMATSKLLNICTSAINS